MPRKTGKWIFLSFFMGMTHTQDNNERLLGLTRLPTTALPCGGGAPLGIIGTSECKSVLDSMLA
jgi:hypothetical protein